jgi:hypothetical protein
MPFVKIIVFSSENDRNHSSMEAGKHTSTPVVSDETVMYGMSPPRL